MGGGGSKSTAKRRKKVKLLLLGGGGVGKSTIFRQVYILYGSGFTDEHRKQGKFLLRNNIIQVAHTLAKSIPDIDLVEDDPMLYHIDNLEACLLARKSFSETNIVTDDIWNACRETFNDERCMKNLDNPNVDLIENASYFINNFDKIKSVDFQPSDEDCLRIRRATQGSSDVNFPLDLEDLGNHLDVNFIDVGGQAHEQLEWPKHSQDLNAIIYVAAVSEYNTTRNGSNLLGDQLKLLKKVVDSPCFKSATILVLLNKTDLLEEKVAKAASNDHFKFSNHYPDYTGNDGDKNAIISYFKDKVESLIKSSTAPNVTAQHPKIKDIVVETTAIDTRLMNKVLIGVFKATMLQMLNGMGMLDM